MGDGEDAKSVVELGAAAEATVIAYHELAIDPEKRLHLALDTTCLQFLSLVIGNGDNNLACKALSTLAALAESQECRAPMASTFGVLHCLKASVEEDNEHTDEMKTKAAELFTCLNFAQHQQRVARRRSKMSQEVQKNTKETVSENNKLSPMEPDAKSGNSKSSNASPTKAPENCTEKGRGVAKDKLDKSESIESNTSTVSASSTNQCIETPTPQSSKVSEERVVGKYYRDPKHRTRMVTLYVKGMLTPGERASVEGALVRVRGVISLVFDLSRSRISCQVRRVLDLSKLGQAVHGLNMGMELYQVVQKGDKDEIEIPLYQPDEQDKSSTSPSESPARQNSSDVELPEYLPEDEDDELTGTKDPKTAVAPSSASFKETASNLFSAAASLLQQSFYW